MENKLSALNAMYDYAVSHNMCSNKVGFANLLNAANSNLSKAFSGDPRYLTDKFIKRVNSVLGGVFNEMWLLYGEGSMLRNNNNESNETYENNETNNHTLPLIPIAAVAGFNGLDIPGIPLAQCPQYSIPDFIEQKAEYLIRVSGSSMYPKYSSGDILACRRIQEITFIQWGKIYVIDSQQGAMVKRLFEIPDNPEQILCQSDNPKYPPFKLPKSEIRSLSIVVGVIRME